MRMRSGRRDILVAVLTAMAGITACTSANKSTSVRAPSSLPALEQEARALVDAVEINYGPLLLKKETVGLDWPALKSKFLAEMTGARSSKEVYASMVRFFASLKDAHVSLITPSTFRIDFDLQFRRVEGKTLLSYLDSDAKSKFKCAAVAGDELTAIEGKSVSELFQMMDPYLHIGNERSTRALQTYNLSKWTENNTLVTLVRQNEQHERIATFSFKSMKSGETFDCTLAGKIEGEPLISFPLNPELGHAESIAAARAEMQRLIELSRKKQKPVKVRDDLSSLSVAGKKSLRPILTAMELQQKLVDLSMPGMDMILEEAESKSSHAARGVFLLGQKRPYYKLPKDFNRINGFGAGLPIIGKPFNMASGVFAGTFRRGDKKIGFIRIPSYMPSGSIQLLTTNLSLRALLSELERKTDLLIIDQTHNPGGAVIFSDWLVSALVGDLDPAKQMTFAVRPRGNWISTYSTLVLELSKIKLQEEEAAAGRQRKPRPLKSYLSKEYLGRLNSEYERIYASYSRGEFLSHPIPLYLSSEYLKDTIDSAFMRLDENDRKNVGGALMNLLYPFHGQAALNRGQVYTKPIYMMIDELDFSGGDATPAVLQDYGRAKLVGVNTAGAGGTVETFASNGIFPATYSLTTSLMVRSGGRMVENVGVKPDIEFELTRQDVAEGFSGTFERMLNQLGL